MRGRPGLRKRVLSSWSVHSLRECAVHAPWGTPPGQHQVVVSRTGRWVVVPFLSRCHSNPWAGRTELQVPGARWQGQKPEAPKWGWGPREAGVGWVVVGEEVVEGSEGAGPW